MSYNKKPKYKMPIPEPKQYYVYEWFNIENQHVFYVGKGIGDRVIQLRKSKRNQFFLRYLNKYKCNFRIVKDDLSEQEALQLEMEIYKQRSINGECECNLVEPDPSKKGAALKGELNGMYHKTHSFETRKILSEANIQYNKENLNSNSRKTIAYNLNTQEYQEFDTKKQCMEWFSTIMPWSEMTCYRVIGYSNKKKYSYNNWCFKVCKVHEEFNKDDTVSSFISEYKECKPAVHTSTKTYEEDVTTKERQRSFYYNNTLNRVL